MPRLSLIAVLLAYFVATAPFSATGREIRQNYTHDGVVRSYILHIPDGIAEDEARPLIVALHDGGGRADRFAEFSNFNTIADRENVIMLYPEGFDRYGNDGRGTTVHEAFAQEIDDVGFLTGLLDFIDGRSVTVDRTRIYATGMSNGGMMAIRLACEAAETFAAVAVVAANMPTRLEPRCRPSAPMPVLVINGTHDRLVPYNGGTVRVGQERLGRVLSTEETVQFWLDKNGCSDRPRVETIPPTSPDDQTETEIMRYEDCQAGTRVVLYQVASGGHTWPGGEQYLPERVVGNVSRDFRAEEAIWDFFKAHSRDAD